MPVQCLTGARFTMQAEILTWAGSTLPPPPPEDEEIPEPDGEWVSYQDPITGEIYNEWKPGKVTYDDPSTPLVDETDYDATVRTIPCLARGIVDGGIRVAGSTERFGDMYENVDFVKLWVPGHIGIKKSDRITNIRAARGGAVVWKDLDTGLPIIFNVNGVVPLFDAWNRVTEHFVLLERADASG